MTDANRYSSKTIYISIRKGKEYQNITQQDIFNKYSTIKYKYDVSLSLQLIHVCAFNTTEMIKRLFMYK